MQLKFLVYTLNKVNTLHLGVRASPGVFCWLRTYWTFSIYKVKDKEYFSGFRMMLWGHIHEYLTNTWSVAPQSVFSTASPHEGASHSALCQQSHVKHNSPVHPLLCDTVPFPPCARCCPTANATTQLSCTCTSWAPQCQLNSAPSALPAPGCPLLKCPTCH